MTVPIGLANTAFKTLLGSLIAVFASILVVLNILLTLVVIRPIRRLSRMADQVSTGNLDVARGDREGLGRGRRAVRAPSTGCASA